MKNKLLLLLVTLTFTFSFAQRNKYEDVLNSKKLGYFFKDVKDKDKDDFYQQYFWLKTAEELRKYPHIAEIRPQVLYEFVKEINPATATKDLSKEDQELRKSAEHSLNQYFSKRDFENPVLGLNLETYVDPSGKKYFTEVNPERVAALLPKKLYTFTSRNKKENKQKTYYLHIDQEKNRYKMIELLPSEKNTKFYEALKANLSNYKFPDFVPEVVPGDRKDKKDVDFFYITPFQVGNDNIVYRTKDFEDYELVKIKKDGAAWENIIDKKKK
jgi:hypothetical protein